MNGMKKPILKNIFYSLLVMIVAIITFSSCTPSKKLQYVREDLPDSDVNSYVNNRSGKTIQPYDYLYIQIYSLDEKTNALFNQSQNNVRDNDLISYPVDAEGNIQFPFVGSIHVKDLTINQAKDKIEKALSNYLNNISVRVRFVGNKITVIGEVNRPGQYPFYDEKVTVFQAISFAGGIANFGNKTNVTLVRENDNKINYVYLNLTDKNIVQSEYYYLLPNDVLIVNPVKTKYRQLRDYSGIYVLITSLSTLFTFYTLFIKK